MIEKYIQVLNTNPFFCGLILQSFYKGFGKKHCDILLQYLVLPIVLYGETRKTLSEINIKTDLDRYVEKNKLSLLELQDRIEQFKKLTNLAMIYLHNKAKIKLDAEIEVIESINYETFSDDLKNYLKASYYLGCLLSNSDTPSICKTLNVIL